MIKRIVLLGMLLLTFPAVNGWALQLIEKDGLHLYFPDKEDQVAAQLLENFQKIVTFLSNQNLLGQELAF